MATRVTTWTEITAPAGTESLAADDGANKRITPDTLKAYCRSGVGPGQMSVTKADGTITFTNLIADGATDNRPTIFAQMNIAAANMPAIVEFGPGDYALRGGMEVEMAPGSRGLTILGAGGASTRLRFHKRNGAGQTEELVGTQFIMFTLKTTTPEPTVGDFPNYLQDIFVDGIDFFDDDPVGHATATEESHAIKMRHTVNGIINNCGATDLGDEAFDLNYIAGGGITNCRTFGTPAAGAGGSVNVQFCSDIIISRNVCQANKIIGTRSSLVGSAAIAVEQVSGLPYNQSNIVISNNVIRDFERAGVYLNNSVTGTNSKNIIVSNNTITNCGDGVKVGGSVGGEIHQVNIIGNTINDCNNGIRAEANGADCLRWNISNNLISNIAAIGIQADVSQSTIADNVINSAPSNGILLGANSYDNTISGGSLKSCGGTSLGSNKSDIQTTNSRNTLVDGVTILASNSTSAVINGPESVRNCSVNQVASKNNQISNARQVVNNFLNGGISIQNSTSGSVISGNRMENMNTLNNSCILLSSEKDRVTITGNYIDCSTTNLAARKAIHIQAGSTYHIISNNIVKIVSSGSTPVADGIKDDSVGATNIIENNQKLDQNTP